MICLGEYYQNIEKDYEQKKILFNSNNSKKFK